MAPVPRYEAYDRAFVKTSFDRHCKSDLGSTRLHEFVVAYHDVVFGADPHSLFDPVKLKIWPDAIACISFTRTSLAKLVLFVSKSNIQGSHKLRQDGVEVYPNP